MPFGLWTQIGPSKRVLDGAKIPHAKGQLLGERTCPGMPNNTAVSCAKMAADRLAIWVVDSGGPKEAQVQPYLPGGANVPSW